MKAIKPTHPGEILREEFMKPMKISAYKLAKDLRVPINRITGIMKEERAISSETALLLSHYFGVSENLWANLQAHYDLECAKDAMASKLKKLPVFEVTGESRV